MSGFIASSTPTRPAARGPRGAIRRAARAIRRAGALAGALAAFGAASAAFAGAPAFLGNWARGDGKTHVQIKRCGSEFCGVNTWVRPGVSGEKVGDRLIANVKPAGPGRWSGTAFDPRRKEGYTIRIHVAGDRLTTDGCVAGGLLCQSMSWTRLGRAS
jgi:uncharacterized protein (DUF2147 family)